MATLNEGGARSGAGIHHNKTRSALVVMKMALAMVLLAGAALLIRTFHDSVSVDPGFQAHNILTMECLCAECVFKRQPPLRRSSAKADSDSKVSRESKLRRRLCLPLEGGYGLPINIEGRPPTDGPYSGGGGGEVSRRSISRCFTFRCCEGGRSASATMATLSR